MTNNILINFKNPSFFSLVLFILFLPNFEAPKNIFFLFFVLAWIFEAIKSRSWGGKWLTIDTIFASWIIIDIIVAINAVYIHGQPYKGSFDIARFVIFGWIISRQNFNVKELHKLVIYSVLSVLPIFILFFTGCDSGGQCLKLNSVGHVNHTAIFLLLTLALGFSYLFFEKNNLFPKIKYMLFFVILMAITFVAILTESRAASAMVIFLFLYFSSISLYAKFKYAKIIIILTLTIAITVFSFEKPKVIDRFINEEINLIGDSVSGRGKIRNFAYEVFKIDPILGTGMSNFPNFNLQDIKNQVIKEKGSDWWINNKDKFSPYEHPHNVYLVYLSGGGVVFFSLFILFWLYISYLLIRESYLKGLDWTKSAAFLAIIINLSIGYVNTTFAHEHALISMLIIGIFLSKYRKSSLLKS